MTKPKYVLYKCYYSNKRKTFPFDRGDIIPVEEEYTKNLLSSEKYMESMVNQIENRWDYGYELCLIKNEFITGYKFIDTNQHLQKPCIIEHPNGVQFDVPKKAIIKILHKCTITSGVIETPLAIIFGDKGIELITE
jgi:hypothetical protein